MKEEVIFIVYGFVVYGGVCYGVFELKICGVGVGRGYIGWWSDFRIGFEFLFEVFVFGCFLGIFEILGIWGVLVIKGILGILVIGFLVWGILGILVMGFLGICMLLFFFFSVLLMLEDV